MNPRDIIQGVLGDNWDKPAGPYVIMETADSILSALKEAGLVVVEEDFVECVKTAIKAGDWEVDGACDPDRYLTASQDQGMG